MNTFGKNINQTNCCDVSNQYFVRGTRSGTVYVYDRNSLSQKILISSSEFDKSHPYPIMITKISPNEQYLAVSTSNNSIFILEFLGTSNSRICKMVSSHQEHKTKVTAICWSLDSQKLLSGDDDGCSFEFWAKVGIFQQSTYKFVKEKTEIVQLHITKEMCVMSALTRSIAINMEEKQLSAIGQAERNGKFGACFLFSPTRGAKVEGQQKPSLTEYIFCSRPQCKVWCCEKKSGKVLSTLKFPELTLKNYNFGKLLPFGPFLLTWNEEYLTVLDVTKMAILELNSELKPIIDVGVFRNICYIIHGEEPTISRVVYLEEKNDLKEEIKEEVKNPEILIPIDSGESKPSSPMTQPVSPINPELKKETPKPQLQQVKQETLIDSIFNIFGGETKPTQPVVKNTPSPVIKPVEKPVEKKVEKISEPQIEKKIEKVEKPIEKPVEKPLEEQVVKVESKPKKKTTKKKVIDLDTPSKQKEDVLIPLDVEIKSEVIQAPLDLDKIPELKPKESFKKPEKIIEKKEEIQENKVPEIKEEPKEIKKEEPKIEKVEPVQEIPKEVPVEEKPKIEPVKHVEVKTIPVQEVKKPEEKPKEVQPEKKTENIEIPKRPTQKVEEKSIVDSFLSFFGAEQPQQKPQQRPLVQSVSPQTRLNPIAQNTPPTNEPPKPIIKEAPKEIPKEAPKETPKEVEKKEPQPEEIDLDEKIETKKIKSKKSKTSIKEFDAQGEVIVEKKKKTVKKVKKTSVNIEEAKPKFEIGTPLVREEGSSLVSVLQELKIEKKSVQETPMEIKKPVEEKVIENVEVKPSSLPKETLPIEEKVEMKPSSLPKQQIEIPQIQKPVVKQSVEDPSIYEEFKIVSEKIDSLYDQLLEYEKTKDTLWCPDFIPSLQEWSKNLRNFAEEERIPKKIDNEKKLKSLLNFWFQWIFNQEEKMKEDNICLLITSLYQFLDLNQVILLCNENQMFKALDAILLYEDKIGFLYQERERIQFLLKDNLEYAAGTVSQLGNIYYSMVLRYLPILYTLNPELSILFSVYHYPIVQYWNFNKLTSKNPLIYKKYLLKLFYSRIEASSDSRFKIHLFETMLNENQKELIDYLLLDTSILKDLKEILKKSNHKDYLIQLLPQDEGLEMVIEDLTLLPLFIDIHHSDSFIWTKLLNHNKIEKEEIVYKMCEYLDSSQILQILNDPSISIELPPKIFDKLAILAESEQKQNQLKHEILETIDQYLWGKKLILSPQLSGLLMNKKEMSELVLPMGCHELTFKHTGMIRYPEESDINWGTTIDPVKKCKICQLPLSETIGSTLTIFQCGHSYHSSCVPHESCSICYQANFTQF